MSFDRWLTTTFVLLSVVLMTTAPLSAAVVTAEFVDGSTDGTPVTDKVDAYPGMAGGGWTGPWTEKTGTVTYTVVTDDSAPLDAGTGKYLDLTTLSSSTTEGGSVARAYTAFGNGIDVTEPHSVEFKYRINEDIIGGTFNSSSDRYQLFDTDDQSVSANDDSSWIIGCYGGSASWLDGSKVGHWVVFNGGGHDDPVDTTFSDARNLDTGIAVQPATTYDFHIDIDPENYAWDVTIGSGGTPLYDSTDTHPNGLGWRTSGNLVGGMPTFGSYCRSSGETRAYALDSLTITGAPNAPYGGMSLVEAHFAEGNTETEVDGYLGKKGDGWKTPWIETAARATINASAVAGEIKTGQGSPYLKVEVPQTESGTGKGAVTRSYATTAAPGIDWSEKHTIEFTLRIDENMDDGSTFTDFDDRYHVFDAPRVQAGTSTSCTWIITAYAAEGGYADAEVVGEWSFYDGDGLGGGMDITRNINTDVPIVTGGVYDFTIVVDPDTRTYDATISYNGGPPVTVEDLGWRTAATRIGGYLTFAGRSDTTDDQRAFSLDAVRLIPEPSLLTLLAMGLIVAVHRRQRR